LGYDVILLRELEQVEIARINALLSRPTDTPIGELRVPQLSLVKVDAATLEAVALAGRQEIAVAAAQEERAEEAVRLAELRNRPSFTIGASRIETGEAINSRMDDSGADPWTVGVGVSIPIWGSRNRARVAEAEAMVDAARAERTVTEDQTRAAVKALYFRLENARRLIVLYEKTLIPQAAAAMEASEALHDGETAPLSGYLETQSVWLNFNLARLRAMTDYQQHRTRLERIVGGPLPEVSP
jgi:outer membrane protein TolC